MNSFEDNFRALREIMSTSRAIFLPEGRVIFGSIVVLMLMWFGAKTMLLGYWNMREFMSMAGRILIFSLALNYYVTPSVFGVSTTGLIIDETDHLSQKLVGASESEALTFNTLTALRTAVDKSVSLWSTALDWLKYLVVMVLLSVLEAVLWTVVASGFVAAAILVIVGPLFLPFGIWPGLEKLAFNWFWALCSFCFYQVIASAYLLVASKLLTYFIIAHPPPYTSASMWAMWVPLSMLGFSLAIGALLVPALALALFNAGGQAAVPRFLRLG